MAQHNKKKQEEKFHPHYAFMIMRYENRKFQTFYIHDLFSGLTFQTGSRCSRHRRRRNH